MEAAKRASPPSQPLATTSVPVGTAAASSSNPSVPTRAVATGRLVFSTARIIALLYKINRNGVTYDELKSFPAWRLTEAERKIWRFLVQDKTLFQKFARLDQRPDTLSAQDIRLAGQLAGNALELSDEDLVYLRTAPELPAPLAASTRPLAPANVQYSLTPDALWRLLAKLPLPGQPPLTISGLSRYQLPEDSVLNVQERQQLAWLQSPTVQRLLQRVGPPNGVLTLEALRVVVSLMWHPGIMAQVPLIFVKPPVSAAEPSPVAEVEGLTAIADEHFYRRPRQPRLLARRLGNGQADRQLQFSAAAMMRLLYHLDPDGVATLGEIQRYRPESPEEAAVLFGLQQHPIFQALARLDGEPESLSLTDIKIAMNGPTLVLKDAHVSLVILPDATQANS
jgi:hypothetical protein